MKNLLLLKRIILVLAVISLLVSWFFTDYKIRSERFQDSASHYEETLKKVFPQAEAFEEISPEPLTFSAKNLDEEVFGYVALTQANGYGGPLKIAVGIGLNGQIISLIIIDHKETPSYLQEVLLQGYLNNFQGTKVTSPFALGIDLDGISGATVTCDAMAKAVRLAAHSVGKDILNLQVREVSEPWHFGPAEAAVIILFSSAIVFSLIWKKPKLRISLLCLSIFVLGFWLNRPISLSYLTTAILGFFPPPRENPLWYIILLTGFGLPVLAGKNIYCFWLCPFGGLQEIINKLCAVKFRLKIAQPLKLVRYLLLWLGIFLAIIYNNPSAANIEPFSTVFGFLGSWLDWVILVAVLILGVISYRFWCTCLCPIGALMDLLRKSHQTVKALAAKVKSLPAPPADSDKPQVESKSG